MPTIAREIDALGGSPNSLSDYGRAFHKGHTAALEAAQPIAENADALVEELVEALTDILDGNRTLDRWAAETRVLLGRVKHRRNL